jgi:hypothetical protein
MKYWSVSVYDSRQMKDLTFVISGPTTINAHKVKKTLLEVHPEYQDIYLKKIKKPAWAHVFEDNK